MDGFTRYFSGVRKHAVLSNEEEKKLGYAYRAGAELDEKGFVVKPTLIGARAGEKIILANLRFVVKTAHKYKRYHNLEDLVQDGNLGLLEALRRWDPDRCFRFITYAVWWIRAMMLRSVMSHKNIVHGLTTQEGRELFFKIVKLMDEQRSKGLSENEGIEEIARKYEISVQMTRTIWWYVNQPPSSLDVPLDDKSYKGASYGGATFKDLLESDEDDVLEKLLRDELIQIVRDAVRDSISNGREWAVAYERILSADPKTLMQLATEFGVSRERVRQIEVAVKKRVQSKLKISIPFAHRLEVVR